MSLLDRFLAAALTGAEALVSTVADPHPTLADPAYRLVVAATVLWVRQTDSRPLLSSQLPLTSLLPLRCVGRWRTSWRRLN